MSIYKNNNNVKLKYYNQVTSKIASAQAVHVLE